MRRIVLLSLFALVVAEGASAQRRGGFAPGFGRGGGGFNRGRVVLPFASGYGYPWNDGGGASYGYAAQQPIFFFPQPAPPRVVEPPAIPARPVVTAYTWPAAASSAPPDADLSSFGIVLKDGTTLSATSVMAVDDVLHYVDPDERHMRVSMRDVNRSATLRLNRERRLNLYLPAAPL